MNSKVRVTADESGAVIKISDKNPEYGTVKVEQTKIVFKKFGWVQKKRLTALLHGSVEELKSMNFFSGQELTGNIIVIEQLEPFNSSDPDKDYKVAGDTGIVCSVDGQPIYRVTIYDPNSYSEDVLVQHTNGEDIKEAYMADLDALAEEQEKKHKKKAEKEETSEEVPVVEDDENDEFTL